MSWRILPILIALPIQFAFAGYSDGGDAEKNAAAPPEQGEPVHHDFVAGGFWAKAVQDGRLANEADSINKFIKYYELLPKYDAKKTEAQFFEVARGPNRLVLIGAQKN